MGEFNGKVVVVTGAAGALGRAVVAYFGGRGARVAQLDIVPIEPDPVDRDRAGPGRSGTAGVRSGSGAGSSSGYAAVCDVTDAAHCRAAVGAIVAELGAVDVLANIAGGFLMGETVHQTSDDTWNFLMGLNAESVLNMARAVVPQMLDQGHGKIVNIGAAAGLRAAAHMGAYSASKSVVIRLTEALAAELKLHNINVNCILPTIIDTPRNRADMPNADFARWVTPAALAEVVGFLASAAADPIHGAALPVPGLS